MEAPAREFACAGAFVSAEIRVGGSETRMSASRDLKRNMIRRDDGAAAVEFAIVSLVLVLLLAGIVQFGYVFNQWQQIEHAAREGARWASLRNDAGAVCSTVIAAAPAVGLTAADITISPGDPSAATPGTPVTVTVVTDVPVFTPLMAEFLGGSSVGLSANATQRVE